MSRGPHVRDLFVGHDTSGFEAEENPKKKKSKSQVKEKSRLGAYKPKILSTDPTTNIPVIPEPERTTEPVGKVNKAFIIGDKDVPMTLEPAENIYSEIAEAPVLSSSNDDETTPNPIFNESPRSPKTKSPRDRTEPQETIDGVAIPPPDYDEEEVTVDFDAEDVSHRRRSVYTEFVGEDFSRYLTDDEDFYEFDPTPRYSLQSSAPVQRKMRKSKTEVRRGDKPQRDSSRSIFRQNNKYSGKNTLRNFSVSDSKLGISLDGKQPKSSLREGVPSDVSYEAFLHARNGTPRPFPGADSSSNDSGHETGDDGSKGGGGNFWKKLTLKIKKAGYTLK